MRMLPYILFREPYSFSRGGFGDRRDRECLRKSIESCFLFVFKKFIIKRHVESLGDALTN
jgi:hypothetical protein